MRKADVLLSVLCAVASQQARADEPGTPGQPTIPAAAPPVTTAPTAASAAGAAVGALGAVQKTTQQVAAPVFSPGVTVVGNKQDFTPEEKELVARGYKLEVRHGERYFCHKEQQLGSRFETQTCDTARSIQAHRVDSQEAVRVIQTNRPGSSN